MKLTQFSQGNNILDDPGFNADCLLLKDRCVSSTLLSRPSLNKVSLSPPGETLDVGSIPFKTKSVLTVKQ
jgi:hypothetical protein